MDSLIQELHDIQKELKRFVSDATKPSALNALDALENSATSVGRAWSGSWIGYHANVYYEGLKPPLPGRHFNSEWGFMYATEDNSWLEYDPDEVKNEIEKRAKSPNIETIAEFARTGKELFSDKRDQVVSIFQAIEWANKAKANARRRQC